MSNEFIRQYVLLPMDQVEFNNYNPNEMTELAMELLQNSIKRNGFIFPISVKKNPADPNKYVIVDGAHRFIALQKLGSEVVPAYVQDHLDETGAKVETIAMNKIHGEQDTIKLAEVIVDLRKTMTDAEIQEKLGYTVTELDEFKDLLEFDIDKIKAEEAEQDADILAGMKDDEGVKLDNEFIVSLGLYELDMVETALKTINPDRATSLFELCQTHLRINHPKQLQEVNDRKEGYAKATEDAAKGNVDSE